MELLGLQLIEIGKTNQQSPVLDLDYLYGNCTRIGDIVVLGLWQMKERNMVMKNFGLMKRKN